jgi:hypothetical protein
VHFRQVPSVTVILIALLFAACATPKVEIEHTPMPDPTDMPMLTFVVTPSAQPATPAITMQATVRPISPTTTSTHRPIQEPLPPFTTPSPWPTPQMPVILSFVVEPMRAGPGESLTLTWASTGGTHATVELGESLLTVPTSGNTTVVVDEDRRHDLRVGLVVSNDTGQTVYRSTTIHLRCPYTYFFEPAPTGWASCPYRPPGFSWAAEQAFENGRMIWLQEIPGESTRSGAAEGPLIYVLYEDGRFPQWQRFEDTWVTGQPESASSIAPPTGLYQPIRGFGKLWRNNMEVRERLGWALEQERGFDGAYQIAWEPTYESDGAYLRAADGRAIALSVLGIWNFIGP